MSTVTLTFDNGPHREGTPHVLETLRRHALKASFFVIGEHLREPGGQELAQRVVAEGHWIGNHTLTHRIPLGELGDPQEAVREIAENQVILGKLGEAKRLFRPSGGGGNLDQRLLNRAAAEHLQAEGYTCVLWNCVPRDWEDPDGWLERALADIQSRDWSLIVLHDSVPQAMVHLDGFLGELERRGVQFVQDFPDECVPIREGQIVADLDRYVTPAAG